MVVGSGFPSAASWAVSSSKAPSSSASFCVYSFGCVLFLSVMDIAPFLFILYAQLKEYM